MEDLKKTLLLHGGNVSQVVKDVLSDFRKLKGVRAQQPLCSGQGRGEELLRRFYCCIVLQTTCLCRWLLYQCLCG